MADLRTDYKDDLLDTSVNTQRKYRQVDNGDGTVSFVDETVYAQNGDTFGASEVNQIHAAVNLVNDSLTLDYSNSSVSDLQTFLQLALNRLFPKVLNLFVNGKIADGYTFTYKLVDGGTHPTTGIINGLLCCAVYDTEASATGNAGYSTKVDLTNYSKIRVSAKINNASYVQGHLAISNSENLTGAISQATFNATSFKETEIDISTFEGEYYVGLKAYTSAGEGIMYTEYIIFE